MDTLTLLNLISLGESSSVQFKRTFDNIEKITPEIAAFLNTNGGKILIGIDDDKTICGVDADKEGKLIQWISEASTETHLTPPASIIIDKAKIEDKLIIIIEVPNGINKPYQTKNKNSIYVKNGADKRIASIEELRRMMQSSDQFHADEMPINNTNLHDIDTAIIEKIVQKKRSKSINELGLPYKTLLENLGFMIKDNLTLSGLLIACNYSQRFKPLFTVNCIRINGTSITDNSFLDKENNFEGTLTTMYEKAIQFIDRNMVKIQVEETINSQGQWKIPRIVFEELIVNALIHRDYFLNASIRIMMFDDRIEILSPGKLPNSQNVNKIMTSSHVPRNPILSSNAGLLLPFIGYGTGIPRIFEIYNKIELIDDREKDQFIAIIRY
jgi:ATP-dependent DNA helicase RecG